MLDEMFKNLKKKSKQENKKSTTTTNKILDTSNTNLNNNFSFYPSINNQTTLTSNKHKQINKEPEIENDFLDEFNKYSDTQKSEEILKKYCTLYADEEMELEKKYSNKNNIFNTKSKQASEDFGKYAVKPLTYEYQQKKLRREENLKTTGPEWFNMRAPELTPELKEDLKALQLKSVIDPSRFYKKSDAKKLPKFFQMGRIVENITDGKKYRLKKSEVKNRLAEEILEADLAKNYTLRKFEELQGKRRKLGLKKMKINKYKMKNKKFAGRKEFVFK